MSRLFFLDAVGWSESYLHYRRRDGGWTDAPGQSMARIAHHIGGFGLDTPDGLEEFVLTDGKGQWVHAESGQGNFRIDSNQSRAHHVVVADKKAVHVPVQETEGVLLVTDLDGTLVGHEGPHCDNATRRFQNFWKQKVAWRSSALVYNTGRTLNSFLELRESRGLMAPIALITSCGTAVHWFDQAGKHTKDLEWEKELKVDGWKLDSVQSAVGAFVSNAKSQNRTVRWRPDSEQSDYRLCVEATENDANWAAKGLEECIAKKGTKVQVIVSGAHGWRYIDVLTTAGGKLHALRHVREKINQQLGMTFSARNTVAAGDSGNDIAMFTGNERGIVVGNAQAELLEWLEGSQVSGSDRIVRTRGQQADGLVEGLQTMGFMST